jgi:hypothetical protein
MTIPTRRARISAAALASALPLALGACGGSDDEAKVKSTVNGLYDAISAKDAGKVCGSLTAAERQKLAQAASRGRRRTSCEATLRFAFTLTGNALKSAKNAKVTDVSVTGDNAAAVVEYQGKKGRLGLTRQGGDWKVNNLSARTP